MNIPAITTEISGAVAKKVKKVALKTPSSDLSKKVYKVTPEALRANFMPKSGKAAKITKAYIIDGVNEDIPLLATKLNGSYLIDFDSQTEVMYGIDAIKYLQKTPVFEYDTQVIFPKKTKGIARLESRDVGLSEGSAIMINAGTKAQIDTTEGYPMIILSKRDYDWYERYGKNAKDINIRNKFDELIYYNSHLYNGSFSPNALLPKKFSDEGFLRSIGIDKNASKNWLLDDIFNKKDMLSNEDRELVSNLKATFDKLLEKKFIARDIETGYIRSLTGYETEYFTKFLIKQGFSEDEIKPFMPLFKQARQVKMESVFTRKNSASDYPIDLLKKMKAKGILYDNKKDADLNVYWKQHIGNESTLRKLLSEQGFSADEQNLIVSNWKKANTTGFDVSGLKFLDDEVAIYNLQDKLNNWTHSRTDWVTNSTALASKNGTTPFVGVSMVRYDGKTPETMAKIRGGQEALHKHPNLNEKRQTEVYLITDGAAILNIEKDGKIIDKLLKKGELAVIDPGVSHCVNSVSGNYEHVVIQLPSAFQYGFGFKSIVEPPEGYDPSKLEQFAIEKLTRLQEKGII